MTNNTIKIVDIISGKLSEEDVRQRAVLMEPKENSEGNVVRVAGDKAITARYLDELGDIYWLDTDVDDAISLYLSYDKEGLPLLGTGASREDIEEERRRSGTDSPPLDRSFAISQSRPGWRSLIMALKMIKFQLERTAEPTNQQRMSSLGYMLYGPVNQFNFPARFKLQDGKLVSVYGLTYHDEVRADNGDLYLRMLSDTVMEWVVIGHGTLLIAKSPVNYTGHGLGTDALLPYMEVTEDPIQTLQSYHEEQLKIMDYFNKSSSAFNPLSI